MTTEQKPEAGEVIGFERGGEEYQLRLVQRLNRGESEAWAGVGWATAFDLRCANYVPAASLAAAEARVAQARADLAESNAHNAMGDEQIEKLEAALASERAGSEHLEQAAELLRGRLLAADRSMLTPDLLNWLTADQATPAPPSEGPASPVAEDDGDFPPFGVCPGDSAALEKLRCAIDDNLIWPDDATQEAGDYEAAVRHSGELALRFMSLRPQPTPTGGADCPEDQCPNCEAHISECRARRARAGVACCEVCSHGKLTPAGEAKDEDMVKLLVETVEEAGGKITFDPKRTNRKPAHNPSFCMKLNCDQRKDSSSPVAPAAEGERFKVGQLCRKKYEVAPPETGLVRITKLEKLDGEDCARFSYENAPSLTGIRGYDLLKHLEPVDEPPPDSPPAERYLSLNVYRPPHFSVPPASPPASDAGGDDPGWRCGQCARLNSDIYNTCYCCGRQRGFRPAAPQPPPSGQGPTEALRAEIVAALRKVMRLNWDASQSLDMLADELAKGAK